MYFSSYESETHRKQNKIMNMFEDCCATGCDVREGSCFQSSEKRQWRVAEKFFLVFIY